jgi:hypothetical protein
MVLRYSAIEVTNNAKRMKILGGLVEQQYQQVLNKIFFDFSECSKNRMEAELFIVSHEKSVKKFVII